MNIVNVFETIVLSSLVGSIIALIILSIKRIFREKLNPRFHYYIWLILLIKLIIPFGPQNSLSISNIYEKFNVGSSTNEVKREIEISTSQEVTNTKLNHLIDKDELQPSEKTVSNNFIDKNLENKVEIKEVLFFIWMLVAVLLIGILVISYKKLREIIRASIRDVDSTHIEILYDCTRIMNIKSKVDILYSTKISSPSLCGFIKPKILIPVNVAKNVCNEEFKYIIMHELIHLKYKDIFISWIINLLSVIYWFNPILLYSFHKMRQDCEISCDNQVISYLDKDENIQYGNSIIRILELGGNSKRIIGIASMAMNRSEIKRRIMMISKYKKINPKNALLGVVVVVIVGTLGISMNTSKAIEDNNIPEAKTLSTDKSIVNTLNKKQPSIEALPIDNSKDIVPFSSDIVIYNSHPEENYPSGIKVTDVGAAIEAKLMEEGISSRFIKGNPPTEYEKSYETTRDLITKNVKDYSDTILLDIHRSIGKSPYFDKKKISFILATDSPYYEENKKFVGILLESIRYSSKAELEVLFYDGEILSYFNQDLSKNSLLIEVGSNISSDSDIEECINTLVSALKNVQKVSSK